MKRSDFFDTVTAVIIGMTLYEILQAIGRGIGLAL